MEPSDRDKQGLGNGPSGDHGPTHANGSPPEDGLLRSVLENSDEVVEVLDPDGTLRYASPAFGRVFGYDPGEVVGKINVLDYVHPDDLPRVLAETEKTLSTGTASNSAEYRFRHADGSWRWVEGVSTYLPDDPAVRGLVVNARDITGRKEAEAALRESERRLSSVITNAHAYAYRCLNEPGWPNEYASDYALQLTGYPPEDLLVGGKVELGDLIVEEDRQRVWNEVQEALSEGRGFELKYALRHRDGRTRHVQEYGQGVYGEDGGVVALEGIVYDVTDHREAEKALKNAEERYRTLVEKVPPIIYIQTPREGEVAAYDTTYMSPRVEEVLGYPPQRFTRDPGFWDSLIHPQDVSSVRDEDERTHETGEPFFMEYRVVAKDGRTVWIRDEATLVRNEAGRDPYWLGVQTDVTGRKEAEERYRTLVEQMPAVTYVEEVGDTYSTLYMSPQVEDLLGYPQADWLGSADHWKRCLHPEDRERVLAENARSDETGEPFRTEYRMVHRDGRTIWVHDEAVLVEGPTGRSGFWQGMLTDVTERAQAENRRREAEERYRTLVERVPAIVYIQESEDPSRTTYVSPQNEAILGYSPEECLADPEHWIRVMHPDDRERVLAEDGRSNETGDAFAMEYRQFAKDGRTVWIRDEATLVRDEAGEPLYWLGVQTDVTERRLTEAKLREAEARYRSLVERVPVAIYRQEIDHSGAVSYISPQIEAITGYAPEEYADPTLWVRTMHPDDRQRVLDEDERTDETGGPFRVEFRKTTKDGRLIWLRDEAVLVRDEAGEPLYWQGVVQDVTERKTLEERLERQALHDSLTGLPNRELFVDRLGQALQRTRRRKGRRAAVLFMDLDGFKTVNDSLGHGVGDLLLTVVAQRLRRCLRPEDALARFGGDEFVVLIEDVDEPAQAVQVAERITEELRWPFRLEGRELFVAASIGVSLGDARTHDPEGLIREADTAMYRAKEAGGDFRVFDPAMHERALGRLELENDLRRAVERGEFVVYYQPIVSLVTGDARGVEALVRWEHPERGLLNPDEFVPTAEESGLVVPMGVAVLEEACRRARAWQEAHPQAPPLVVSVNISARQLARPDLAGTVERVLERTGFEGNCLALDVTETVYVEALEANTAALDRLKALGVRFSIDDFGTGYSSLSYLKRLPADAIKIDKSFVRGLGEDAGDTVIVGMVVKLAHNFGLEVVAEGVESEAQANILKEMGCDFAQGYHFSRPLPPEEVLVFLAE